MKKEIIIKATIEERWVDVFCSFLKALECNGKIGHSCMYGFYADGDGDFRPKFDIDTDFNIDYSRQDKNINVEKVFDAG